MIMSGKMFSVITTVEDGFLDGYGVGTTNYALGVLRIVKEALLVMDKDGCLPFAVDAWNTVDGGYVVEAAGFPGRFYMVIRPHDPPYLTSYDGNTTVISEDDSVIGIVKLFGRFIEGWLEKNVGSL